MYVFLSRPREKVTHPLPAHIKECSVLETGMPMDVSQADGTVTINVPQRLFKDSSIQVLKIVLR